ncbi:hypothetical protein LJC20_02820 [Eubacteriales bacterium OttesenSCG-928-M02]|nr:hypothetical protein [Eubacteriales bacterium OttesenSCG-928-M02]
MPTQKEGLTLADLLDKTILVLNYYDILYEAETGNMAIEFNLPIPPNRWDIPSLYYDGGEHAILLLSPACVAVCGHIHPDVRTPLSRRDTVLFIENPDHQALDAPDLPSFSVPVFLQHNASALGDMLLAVADALP